MLCKYYSHQLLFTHYFIMQKSAVFQELATKQFSYTKLLLCYSPKQEDIALGRNIYIHSRPPQISVQRWHTNCPMQHKIYTLERPITESTSCQQPNQNTHYIPTDIQPCPSTNTSFLDCMTQTLPNRLHS